MRREWWCSPLTLCELSTSAGRLAQDGRASRAHDDALRVAEDGGDLVAAGAFHVHEVRVRVLYQALELVLPLLLGGQRVQQIFSELQSEKWGGGGLVSFSRCLRTPMLLSQLLRGYVCFCCALRGCVVSHFVNGEMIAGADKNTRSWVQWGQA